MNLTLFSLSCQVLDALDEIAFNAEFDSYRISKERKAVQAEAQVCVCVCVCVCIRLCEWEEEAQ